MYKGRVRVSEELVVIQPRAVKHVWNEVTKVRILFLDDMPERIPLIRNYEEVVYVRNGEEFKQWLKTNDMPDVISFDNSLADAHYHGYHSDLPTGEDCVKWAIENGYIPKIAVIHSWDEGPPARMEALLKEAGCNDVRRKKFNPNTPLTWRD
jgi:hypothetical protein